MLCLGMEDDDEDSEKLSLDSNSLSLSLCIDVMAQEVPPAHSHSGPICWGYAVGRAFGKSWTSTPDCNCSVLNRGSIGSKQNDRYFDWYKPYDSDSIKVKDIIEISLNGKDCMRPMLAKPTGASK